MAWETRSTQAAPGAREKAQKQGFEEDRHMYKKHGRDRETNLELQVKALVARHWRSEDCLRSHGY